MPQITGTETTEHADKQGIKQWQQFLSSLADPQISSTEVVSDGYFGPVTQRATCAFQTLHGLKPTGVVDAKTLEKAEEAAPTQAAKESLSVVRQGGTPEREFELGPDKGVDLRECRPYFLAPMDDLGTPEIHERLIQRIDGTASAMAAAGAPVTDLFVISHGWHRNFFDAVAAYDRLLSRFILLKHRGRLKDAGGVHPLFVCLHWHSDPGQDNWVDPAGRRNKEDFVQKVCAKLEPLPNSNRVAVNDFEDIFEFLSSISAYGTAPFDPQYDTPAADNMRVLGDYALVNATDATLAEKSAVVWRCFQETTPRKPVDDQHEKPGRFRRLWSAVLSVVNFLIGSLGLLAAAGLLLRVIPPVSTWPGLRIIDKWWDALKAEKWTDFTTQYGHTVGWLLYNGFLLVVTLAVLAAAALVGWLYLVHAGNRTREHSGHGRGHAPYPAVLAWLPLQLLITLPSLLFLVFTMLFGSTLALLGKGGREPGLYDERDGKRDESDPPPTPGPKIRELVFNAPRWPIRLLRSAVGSTSPVQSLGSSMDKQFAFLEMQVKGVQTGRESAEFLADLLKASSALSGARIHLIGHSFGCLVVSNLLRQLALSGSVLRRFRSRYPGRQVQTVCMLEAAIGSNWFEGEPRTVDLVSGAIASIYSRYDSACGFFYPVANNSRLAAGSVGLYGGETFTAEHRDHFISLVSTPDLDTAQFGASGQPAGGRPRLLNLDASRIVYAGPVPSGGAHTDIFKEDVLQLTWAVVLDSIKGGGKPDPLPVEHEGKAVVKDKKQPAVPK